MKSSPCELCYQTPENCFCAFIAPVTSRVPFVMIQHWKEQYRSSNTGRLLTLAIPGTPCFTNFNWEQLDAMSRFLEAYQPYLLYPSPRAVTVTQFQEIQKTSTKPLCVVLIDGTWRQAKRLRQRIATLRMLPCLRLDPEIPSSYQLRRQSKTHHLSTIEAVIQLMKSLDCADVQPLERLFEILVHRGLQARGKFRKEERPFIWDLPPSIDSDPNDVELALESPDFPESSADSASVVDK